MPRDRSIVSEERIETILAAFDADVRLGVVPAAGMADRLLHSALVTTGQEIPQRFFHRRARAVAIGMISPTLGETLDDLRWIRNRIVHHASDAESLWLPPQVDRVGRSRDRCEQPQDADGFRDAVAASIGELLTDSACQTMH